MLSITAAPAAEIAYHAHAAHHDETAFQYWLQAGDNALDSFVVADALDYYEKAHRISASITIGNPDLVRLFEQRIKALELARNYADALKVSREMLTIANKRNSATMECAATLAQAVLFIAEQT
ncbi:MAG: hypothetical protein GWP61_24920 [Chloroflexi bacterium]|jgi:predicted ATPase|nr:hypothetical protein [Chloroflexota bacterium]